MRVEEGEGKEWGDMLEVKERGAERRPAGLRGELESRDRDSEPRRAGGGEVGRGRRAGGV